MQKNLKRNLVEENSTLIKILILGNCKFFQFLFSGKYRSVINEAELWKIKPALLKTR